MAEKLKLNYGKTILIGFGFLASSIAWAIYDPYITKMLNRLLTESDLVTSWSAHLNTLFPALAEFAKASGNNVSTAAGGITLVPLFIGVIMTFDNIFGVIFQPTFGKLSDRCHSKLGKRRPFIVTCAPISAVIFALIPLVALTNNLPATMICIILFVFVMSLWRAPVVALMPDLTPPSLRSEGNAVINLMGGIGGLIGLVVGTPVVMVMNAIYGKGNYDEQESFPYVFLIGSVIMVAGMLVLLFKVKEPDTSIHIQNTAEMNIQAEIKAQKAKEKAERKAIKLSSKERKSLVFMLVGLFFLFCGSNAISTFFALFAYEVLGKTTAQATIMMAVFGLCSALAAIPAGIAGKKLGRKKTIMIGLAAFLTAFIAYLAVQQITGQGLVLVWVALIVGGAANMFITVNTLPLVLEIGGVEKIGTFTGYYYTATFSAQIATPILYGMVRMLTGTYMSLFVYCPICFALSILSILVVKHGEAIPEEVLKKVREEND